MPLHCEISVCVTVVSLCDFCKFHIKRGGALITGLGLPFWLFWPTYSQFSYLCVSSFWKVNLCSKIQPFSALKLLIHYLGIAYSRYLTKPAQLNSNGVAKYDLETPCSKAVYLTDKAPDSIYIHLDFWRQDSGTRFRNRQPLIYNPNKPKLISKLELKEQRLFCVVNHNSEVWLRRHIHSKRQQIIVIFWWLSSILI